MTVAELPLAPLATPARPVRSDTLQSVSGALDLLDCFLDNDEWGVSDVARRLGIAKSSAHRLLTTLAARGMVEKNPESGLYRLGVHMLALGRRAEAQVKLPSLATTELKRLHLATGQSAFVGILDGNEPLYPRHIGAQSVAAQLARFTVRGRGHASSVGRAVAAVDPERAASLRKQAAASPEGPGALLAFERALESFKANGVVLGANNFVPGLAAVAAPVRALDGRGVGALIVAGPTSTFLPLIDHAARLLRPAAARLSRQVGA